MTATAHNSSLIVRAGTHTCALNLVDIVEIMRPLPVSPLAGGPEVVCGLSVIRGSPVPVVVLATLLNNGEHSLGTRFVTIRAGDRTVALSVDAVLGIREFDPAQLSELAPLLQGARLELVDAVGALDAELFLVLKTGKLVPDSVWALLAGKEA